MNNLHEIPHQEEGTVMIVSDIHWSDSGPQSILNYLPIQDRITMDIERIMVEEGVTHLIQMGDWCNKGYRDDEYKYKHNMTVARWNEHVKGNLAMVLGNHFFIQNKTNPELYWIQPNDKYHTPKKSIVNSEPLVKLPDTIRVGNVLFSLFHYEKDESSYYNPDIPDDIIHHVGLYHGDNPLPQRIREEHFITKAVTTGYNAKAFSNVDHAIYGHIHTPYPTFNFKVGNNTVVADVLGSVQITSTAETHNFSRVVLYKIKGDNFTIKYIDLPTYRSELVFSSKDTDSELRKTIKPGIKEQVTAMSQTSMMLNELSLSEMSAVKYLMRNGISPEDIRIYQEHIAGAFDMRKYRLLLEGENNE